MAFERPVLNKVPYWISATWWELLSSKMFPMKWLNIIYSYHTCANVNTIKLKSFQRDLTWEWIAGGRASGVAVVVGRTDCEEVEGPARPSPSAPSPSMKPEESDWALPDRHRGPVPPLWPMRTPRPVLSLPPLWPCWKLHSILQVQNFTAVKCACVKVYIGAMAITYIYVIQQYEQHNTLYMKQNLCQWKKGQNERDLLHIHRSSISTGVNVMLSGTTDQISKMAVPIPLFVHFLSFYIQISQKQGQYKQQEVHNITCRETLYIQ